MLPLGCQIARLPAIVPRQADEPRSREQAAIEQDANQPIGGPGLPSVPGVEQLGLQEPRDTQIVVREKLDSTLAVEWGYSLGIGKQ